MLHTLVEEPKAVILDIGGFTADYLLMKKYESAIFQNCKDGKLSTFKKLIPQIVKDYDELPLTNEKKPKVDVYKRQSQDTVHSAPSPVSPCVG